MSDQANEVGKQRAEPFSLRHNSSLIWLCGLVLAAWTVALVAVLTKQTFLIDHQYLLTQSHLFWPFALLIFLAAWQIMILGMMLPSSLPFAALVAHASQKQRHPLTTLVAFIVGYAVIWTAFALVAFSLDTLIHWLVDRWFWLYLHPWLIGAVTFLIAGAFQFTPLKRRCLHQCMSPLSFFMRYYREGRRAAWEMGLRHGVFCLGCCWALMLVMFGIGVGSLIWMGILTGVMVMEKAIPGGSRISPAVGVVLLLLALLWLVHPAWLQIGIG
jgi:predicted metal-binding membrane protein